MERTKSIPISPTIIGQSDVTVLLTGTFSKDPQGRIIIPYNQAFEFNFLEKKYINGLELDYEMIKKELNIN